VSKMVGMRWNKGSRQYLVRWKGYATSVDTWEPMENLVGCAQQIREYKKLREKEDIEAKAAVLAKRQEAKNAAAAVEVDLKARAAEAALAGAGDGDAAAAHCADTTGSDDERLPSRELPPPPAERSPVPPPEWKWLFDLWKICQPFQPIPHFFFRSKSLQGSAYEGSGDLTGRSNISATRGRQDTRFCVCESPRGDLSHIASLTLCCSRSFFFRSHSESSRPHSVGGRD
jgi:hypothetical protein